MSDPTDEELPALGTPTPSGPSGPASRRTRLNVAVAAAVALLVGLAAGVALATALDEDGGSQGARPPASDTDKEATGPPTTVDTLPEECVATMRSAQQTLGILDQGLRDLRNLDLGEVDRAVREVQQLREGLDADVRRCLELMGD